MSSSLPDESSIILCSDLSQVVQKLEKENAILKESLRRSQEAKLRIEVKSRQLENRCAFLEDALAGKSIGTDGNGNGNGSGNGSGSGSNTIGIGSESGIGIGTTGEGSRLELVEESVDTGVRILFFDFSPSFLSLSLLFPFFPFFLFPFPFSLFPFPFFLSKSSNFAAK